MGKTIRQHRMSYTTDVGKTAVALVTHFLTIHWWAYTVAVHSVEDDPAYQPHDVDLLWTIVGSNGRLRTIPLEVKGDRYHNTGNFFLETVSNANKQTAGCFLYTKAYWLFYVFVEVGDLYCIPMNVARPWFAENSDRFPEARTSTPVGGESYVTVGRLVPIQTLREEIPATLHYRKSGDAWTAQ
jgi:hypothetical protein